MVATVAAPPVRAPRLPALSRSGGLVIGVIGVLIIAILSLRIGAKNVDTQSVWNALFHFDPQSYDQTVVRSLRLPRTVIAISIGATLAVAGTVMQAVTRNPLADPSILGVSSGASFAVVAAVFYGGMTAAYQYVWFAFAGALLAAVLVFIIGSVGHQGPSPVKLALAGIVVSQLLAAWTSAMLLLDRQTFETVRFWFAGSVAGRPLNVFWTVAPFIFGGTLVCLFLGHQLNVLSLGDEAARGLGMQTNRIRIISSILVVIMTGAAVSTAGPIGYVGLAIPHMVRSVVGPDYRWILPYSLLTGAIFLTAADIVGRVVMRPGELEVGIATAIAGAPFMIYLARQRVIAS